jgi:5-hydroxyisourate hydrolase-like protein (transthyretin family)
MKKILVMFMAAILLVGIGGYTETSAVSEIGLKSANVSVFKTDLSISNSGVASVTVSLQTYGQGTASNSMTIYLMKKNGSTWDTVTTWTTSNSSKNLNFSKTKQLSSKGTYKVKATANTRVGDSYEMYTTYSSQVTY